MAPKGPASGRRTSRRPLPKWLTRWHETGVDGRTDRDANDHLIADGPRRSPGWPTRRASRSTPGPGSCPIRGSRRSPTSTSIPARRRPGTRPSSSPGSIGRPSSTSVSAATPRRPASAASRSGSRSSQVRLPRNERLGRARQSRPSGRRSRNSSPGSGRRRTARARPASTTPRTRASRPSWRRTASGRRPARPVSTPITWDELDDPDIRPDRWTIRDLPERVAKVGDLFAAAQTDLQELPPV